MNTVYILTGSNLGHRLTNLLTAKEKLVEQIGKIVASSSVYETEPWGKNDQPDFYNQVLILKTEFSPEETMKKILNIEEQMGRIRTTKNASRIIDIDILFFNDDIIDTQNLTIPHPEITNRRFVLIPLNELSPGLVHPLLKKDISELLFMCKDTLNVKPLKNLMPY